MIARSHEPEKLRLAMLIDGDNSQPSLMKEMLAETSKYGRITIRRIYGDWTTPNMNGWKDTLQDNAVQPVQQFRYTVGKNATDSAMIIDAMDVLHSGLADGFCLVSSDSDYTRLATRIREKGFFVMGIGQRKTPKAFCNACDVFVYTENLAPSSRRPESSSRRSQSKSEASKSEQGKSEAPASPDDAVPLLLKACELVAGDDGWAQLGAVGDQVRKLDPSFDHRTYGCRNLRALVQKLENVLETEEEKEGNSFSVYVRAK